VGNVINQMPRMVWWLIVAYSTWRLRRLEIIRQGRRSKAEARMRPLQRDRGKAEAVITNRETKTRPSEASRRWDVHHYNIVTDRRRFLRYCMWSSHYLGSITFLLCCLFLLHGFLPSTDGQTSVVPHNCVFVSVICVYPDTFWVVGSTFAFAFGCISRGFKSRKRISHIIVHQFFASWDHCRSAHQRWL